MTRSVTVVSGQTFSSALRVQTVTQPANAWDAGATLPTSAAVAKDDVIAGEIWVRRILPSPGDGFVTFNFEKAGPDYDKSHTVTMVAASTNWTRFRFAFKSFAAYAAGGAHIALHLGFPPQTIELGGLVMTNYAKTRQLSEFPNDVTYPGREPDAPWRAAAAQRIEQLRKADLTVTVRDTQGFPVPQASVAVRMRQHAFEFGSAVAGTRILGQGSSAADRDRYRGVVTNWFNKVVLENDLKWPNWEAQRATATNALTWLRARGLPVRGHNLIWPSAQWLPADVPALYSNSPALRQRINSHFTNILGAVRGQCVEWDVINEPYANHEVMDVLGSAEKIEWFKLARALDSTPVLYLNEYGNLEVAGLNSPQTDDFFNQLTYLQNGGAPLGGIGMQSHFSSFLPHPEKLLVMLDRFSSFGLPIQATELDVDSPDETVQADYLVDFSTALFSHPSVNGIMMWGFWEGQHWRPRAALIRNNWTLKPNGVAWSNLVFQAWWTSTNAVTGADGSAAIRGFKGYYDLEVVVGGVTNRVPATLLAATNVVVTVPPAPPPFISAALAGSEIHLTWPGDRAGYELEVSGDLAPASWTSAGPAEAGTGSGRFGLPSRGQSPIFASNAARLHEED